MTEPVTAPEKITRYDLRVTRGGLHFRMRDRGIAPGPDSLSFMMQSQLRIVPYRDVAEVNLGMFTLSNMDVAQMRITFRDGSRIVVLNTDDWGYVKPEITQEYYRFKADLHQRLVAADAFHIRYTTGHSQARSAFLTAMVALLGGIFLILPPIFFVISRQPQALIPMVGGIFFTLPFLRVARRNQPGIYDPRDPPDMLR